MGKRTYAYWKSRENCKAEIAKYKTLKKFREKCHKGYVTILRNGWEDLLQPLKRYGKSISYDYCLLVSLACDYPFEVLKLDSSVYYKIKRRKWEKQLWSHFTDQPNKQIIWTQDKCREVALLCNSRSEFEKRFLGAYSRALKDGWINDICSHMKPLASLNSRSVYAIEFSDKSVYIGLTYSMRVRLYQHFKQVSSNKYIEEKKRTHRYRIHEKGTNLSMEEAQALEDLLIKQYRDAGWKSLNIARTGKGRGALGIGIKKWTKKEIIKAAKSCKTAKEFRTKFPVAYGRASFLKILNEVQAHFKMKSTRPKGYWNVKENCLIEAKKFKTPGEMKSNSKTAYSKIIKNGWRTEAFAHMKYLKPWKR